MVRRRRTPRSREILFRRASLTRVFFGSVLLALLALLAGAGILLPVSPAQAHAVLVRASPPSGAALDRGPREISLRFSEPIDRRVSAIDIHDAGGRAEIPRSSVAANGLTLSAPLPQLPRGMYTVRWRVLSAVDGHVTSGFYLFAVGPASPEAFRASAGTKPDDAVVVARAREALAAGEFQWAAELADCLLTNDGAHIAAKHVKAQALTELGERQINANARNYYLSAAQFLLRDLSLEQ
ncbi:MAG: hypothetical protein FJX78_09195 [Armatimonadetes bacterium]|nr:hypothetical protein [Armatimonadota bacterium]